MLDVDGENIAYYIGSSILWEGSAFLAFSDYR